IREIEYFADRLREQGMPRDALVVNRIHPRWADLPDIGAVARELDARGISLGKGGPEKVLQAVRDEAKLGELDGAHVGLLAGFTGHAASALRVEVPALAGDVHDLTSLAEVAAALVDSRP